VRLNARAYYAARTPAILEKYGPGPRVHFHSGFADPGEARCTDASELRRRLVRAQERALGEALHAWGGGAGLGRVVEVGCGLGGGAIHWAEQGARHVVAITDVREHARRARAFAERAGVADRVAVLAADAHALPLARRFDTAISIESSCYLDTAAWFAALASCLRPGGRVLIADSFAVDAAAKREFDRYWSTDIAPVDHYVACARSHGFTLERRERLNERALGFWDVSLAWVRCRLREPGVAPEARSRLRRSLAAHRRFRQMYETGEVEYLRLAFRLPAGR
jgi:cyclopropane fatty-acyl-phospholipid synthase-like methyltransferase